MKLRYQREYRVAGSYVHSATSATMHRRAYRLLPTSSDDSTADGGAVGGQPRHDWVLLHYLDTMEAAQVSALFADDLAAAEPQTAIKSDGHGGGVPALSVPPYHAGGSLPEDGVPLIMGAPAYHPSAIHADDGALTSHNEYYPRQQQWPAYTGHVVGSLAKMEDKSLRAPAARAVALGAPSAAHAVKPQVMDNHASINVDPHGIDDTGKDPPLSPHKRESSLDDCTMDILWNMVMEEGSEGLGEADYDHDDLQEAAASALSQHMGPIVEAKLVDAVEGAIQDMATSALGGRATLDLVNDEDIRNAVEKAMDDGELGTVLEDQVVGRLEDELSPRLEQKLVESMEKELTVSAGNKSQKFGGHGVGRDIGEKGMADFGPVNPSVGRFSQSFLSDSSSSVAIQNIPQTPLPEIIDFTPAECCVDSSKLTQIVISTSAAIPILPPDNLPYRWHLFAAFVGMGSGSEHLDPAKATRPTAGITADSDLMIMKISLSPLRKLTPFSYKCAAVSRDISHTGTRSVILLGVQYIERSEPMMDAIRMAVKVSIQAEWQVASDLNDANAQLGDGLVRPTFYAPAGGGNVQLLSQISQEMFHFYYEGEYRVDAISLRSSKSDRSDGGSNKNPAPPPAMASVASALTSFQHNPPGNALEVGQAMNKKRSRSMSRSAGEAANGDGSGAVGGIGRPQPCNEVVAANEVASDWIGQQIEPDSATTLGETVDRHCKIRFVERLANVLVATDDDGLGRNGSSRGEVGEVGKIKSGALLEASNQSDNSGGANAATAEKIFLDDNQLNLVNDSAIDSLLDSVLIRFVESLMESSTSEEEVKVELNATGFSGFALLHYAALYNMKSLIPLMLSRGADPDMTTDKGDLTALHLASGAGHDQVVDLLVRNGARLDPRDSFGLTPAHHAVRNGFSEIAKWLTDSCPQQGKVTDQQVPIERDLDPKWMVCGDKDDLIQRAFRGLPLKDKLGLNLFVQKYRREANGRKSAADDKTNKSDGGGGDDGGNEDMEEDAGIGGGKPDEVGSAGGNSGTNNRTAASMDDTNSQESLNLQFISDEDRESLKAAMSMMSVEEVEELERHAPYSDVRNWMLRSNYESLKEASRQLERQSKRNITTKKQGKSGSTRLPVLREKQSRSNAKLSQALAMLVLRKNLLQSKALKSEDVHQA